MAVSLFLPWQKHELEVCMVPKHDDVLKGKRTSHTKKNQKRDKLWCWSSCKGLQNNLLHLPSISVFPEILVTIRPYQAFIRHHRWHFMCTKRQLKLHWILTFLPVLQLSKRKEEERKEEEKEENHHLAHSTILQKREEIDLWKSYKNTQVVERACIFLI